MAVDSVSNQKTIQQIINETSNRSTGRNTGELGKNDFLNLLVTQLRYQDPLKPVDDKEFIAQMAQFSSLEQMQNLNGSITQMQAFSIIGKHVTASIVDETSRETKAIEGEVSNVKIDGGKTYVVVNGSDIPIDRVTNVTEGYMSSQSNLYNYTNLIGTYANGCIYDPKTGEIVKVSGSIKAIQKGLYEDYAVMDGVKVDVSDILSAAPSTDPNFTENYLKTNKGKEITVEVIDRSTGKKVPVKAVLRDYSIDGNKKVTVTLDGVNVPVDSLTNITKPAGNISEYANLVGENVRCVVEDSETLNRLEVTGIVDTVNAKEKGIVATVNGVRVMVQTIDGLNPANDPELLTRLRGKEVKVVMVDSTGNVKVTVKAVLKDLEIIDGKVWAKLDKMEIPVDNIVGIISDSGAAEEG